MECILDYLENTKKLPKPVVQVLSKTLCKYTDIAREFVQWINTREYPSQNALFMDIQQKRYTKKRHFWMK